MLSSPQCPLSRCIRKLITSLEAMETSTPRRLRRGLASQTDEPMPATPVRTPTVRHIVCGQIECICPKKVNRMACLDDCYYTVHPTEPKVLWLRYRRDEQVGWHVMAAFLPALGNRCSVDNMLRVQSNVVGANIFVPGFLSNMQRLTRRQYDVK